MDEVQVITISDHDGWITYYVIPAEHADDIVMPNDVYEKEEELDCVLSFSSPTSFAEWARENPDVEFVGYWESREI